MKAVFFEALPYRSDFRVGSHHYAERFLEAGWEILWLSQPISALHYLRRQKKDWAERVRGWRKGPVTYGQLRYYSPFTLAPTGPLPVLRSEAIANISARLTTPSIARILREEGFSEPDVVWLTNPTFEPVASTMHARCTVVRVADDTAAFANVPASMRVLEERAIARADVVFAVASGVCERVGAERAGVVRLPNGVDEAFFSARVAEPADLAPIPGPRVVYVGAMEAWFDGELVAECARRSPDVSFVLIGPDGPGRASLGGLPNVHFLGSRPYAEVRGYLQHSDAGIIPFRTGTLVDSIHPIKLYEYMATGLPVVAVSWHELATMASPARLTNREGFCDALADVLQRGRSHDEKARRDYARDNSWDARFEVVQAEISRVLTADGGVAR